MKRKKTEDETLGKELAMTFKKRLLEQGKNSKDIFLLTGIKNYTVSRIFSRDPIISLENAVKIARSTGLSLDYLFDNNSDVPFVNESIKSIQRQTGLTYQSIQKLMEIKESRFTYINSLNKILSYSNIDQLLLDIESYLDFKITRKISFILPLDSFDENPDGSIHIPEQEVFYKDYLQGKYQIFFDENIEMSKLETIKQHISKLKDELSKKEISVTKSGKDRKERR